MLIIDKYAYNNRLLHTSPVLKGLIYLCLLGVSFSGIPSMQFLLLFSLPIVTCYIARVHWLTYIKWFILTFPFVFLSLVTLMISFMPTQQDMIWSIALWNGYLGVTMHSLVQTGIILLRVYCSLIATYFFILTVPFQQIVTLLMLMKCPKFLTEIIILMYRFIFMFLHEFIVMRDTLDLKFGFRTAKQSYQSMGLLASQLFTRLMKTNEHLNQMLELRFDE